MKERFYTFMQGRYGVDQLNTFLMIICIACFVISLFIQNVVITFLAYASWLVVIFRMFSKNIFARNRENEKYLNFFKPVSRFFELKLMSRQDPMHKYFCCPKCKQRVRVPKGRGKIIITCPSCQNKFEKRT
ncbi:hypothetical protein [uncultured Thomasclavelia sp.]|uniref:hypothetical protein n=1 Tax=uncultured Thomasclavelia sp. TaxID=3025759 RepID=UPI0025F08C66|nr:hypothetical protein [uncultured Thomasclavelia sp.]